MKFTPSQEQAIRRAGQDVCVIAGPGSGKTRVLTERFAWLVEQGVSPKAILAITFTEKAASEIRRRVQKRVSHPEVRQAPISTLHAFCIRTLKEFAIAAGLDPSVQLWDERIAAAELYATVEETLNQAAHEELASLRQLFTAWSVPDPSAELAQLYEKLWSLTDELPALDQAPRGENLLSELRGLGQDVLAAKAGTEKSREYQVAFREWLNELGSEVNWQTVGSLQKLPPRGNLSKDLKEPASIFYARAAAAVPKLVSALTWAEKSYLLTLLGRIAERFAERKRLAARMDFKDFEHWTIRLLEKRPDVRMLLQNRYEHILMDEMQDTNPVQWRLLNLLRTPGGFYAVGDINQSIYRFRYAAPQLFRDYRSSLEAGGWEVDRLAENFRSRSEILEFTETVLEGQPGIEKPGLRGSRQFQTRNAPVRIFRFASFEEEYQWIAAEIQSLLGRFVVEDKESGQLRRASYRDMAILVRKTNTGEAIAKVLADCGIPLSLGGGRGFFDQQEVIDLIRYLAYLANPLDELSAAAVWRSPLVGASDEELRRKHVDPEFLRFQETQREDMDWTPPDVLLSRVLDWSGYLEGLEPAGRANVAKLLDIVRAEWARGPKNMRAFVEELESMRAAKREKSAVVAEAEDAVSVLTVHAAKGLEYPIVFVASAQSSVRRGRETLDFDPAIGVGVRWLNPLTGARASDREYSVIQERAEEEDKQESERLLFVALTRAEQKVYVSWKGERKDGWVKYLKDHAGLSYSDGEDPADVVAGAAPKKALTARLLKPMPPMRSGLSSVTPTGLAQYAQCPRRFYLDQLCGLANWPSEEREVRSGAEFADGQAKELGTEVHELLAGKQTPASTAAVEALVSVFQKSALGQRAGRAEVVEREFDFVFAEAGVVIEGQIDLWFVEGGEVVVVDYKTDRVSALAAPARARIYAMQLAVYRRVVGKLFPGLPVRAYLHFLRPDVLVEVADELDGDFLSQFAAAQAFPTQVGEHCQRCAHRQAACDATL